MKIAAYLKKSINFFFRIPTDCSVLYGKSQEFSRVLPKGIVNVLKDRLRPRWYAFTEPIRISNRVTRFLGQEFPQPHKKIEIDITYECNLRCAFCDRFLDIFPSKEMMSVQQIEKFIEQSIRLERKWEAVHLIGGEAVLHPQILPIIELLKRYRDSFSPATEIAVFTNGCNAEKMKIIPEDIRVVDSHKNTVTPWHVPVTLAPVDLAEYTQAAFYNGCSVPVKCGMGLNMYGYYQCAAAAAIDRILGLDLGRKQLPGVNDDLIDQYKSFCRYCGHFIRDPGLIRGCLEKKETVSRSWKKLLSEYSGRDVLTRY